MPFRLSQLRPASVVVAEPEAVPGIVVAASVETAEKFAAVAGHRRAAADRNLPESKPAEDGRAENTQAGCKLVVSTRAMNTMAANGCVRRNSWIHANDHRNDPPKNDRGIQLRQNLPTSQKIRSIQQPAIVCECDESWQRLLKVVSF